MTGAVELSEAKRRLFDKMISGEGAVGTAAAGRVTARHPDAVIPLSSEQSECWLHGELASGQQIYNESVTIHRKGSFDLAVLERSFNEVLRRHEIWRTSIGMADGEIVQQVQSELEVCLALDDLTSLARAEREQEAKRLATLDAGKSFDLATVPLFRLRVVKIADDEHRIYLAMHHIIFDGVSMTRIFIRELATIYEAFALGKPSPLPDPTLQYADYAVWRQQGGEGGRLDEKIGHWREALGGTLPKLGLSTSYLPRAEFTYRGATARFTLPAELTAALKAFSQANGVTLYMVLLAAFKTMLFRYTSQQDILIGGVTDQRLRPELRPLMGYFLGMTAMRTQPAAELSFRHYLAQVRLEVLRALDASEVPVDQVIREVGIKREGGGHPLFEAVFSIQPIVDPYPEGWDLTQMDVELGLTKYDLYLELEVRSEGMIGRFVYAADLFEPVMIERMIGHWRIILEGAIANPDSTLARLPMMTVAQEHEMLIDWNATQKDVRAGTVDQWFAEQARRTPDKIAVEFDGQLWNYRELDRQSDTVAKRLRQAGLQDGMLVGIFMNRSADMVAGLLGIWKAGAAYLPLDPAFPQPRLAFIVDNAKPDALLTEGALLSSLPVAHLPVVLCDAETEPQAEPVKSRTSGASLAYVLYTSGSTGYPKGVEVPHSGVVNFLSAMQTEPGFGPDDSLLSLLTIAFDVSVYELFLPLVSGGRLVIASGEVALDLQLLAQEISRSRCTTIVATPATWRALVETGWQGSEGLTIVSCGEALSRSLADELQMRCGSLWNGYGPTETTILSTVHKVSVGAGPVSIGKPIGNTQIYILDPWGNPDPVGVAGELYIAGAGIALGYRNSPAQTAERFVGRPFAPGARLYRTGDLARYRPDGSIDYLGRTDREEKIRGFRVAVEEVEGALCRHSEISAAAVRSWPDSSGNKALTAYVVSDRQDLSLAEVRAFLGDTLPNFMLPSHVMPLQQLPTTPSGKIDRQKLPPPETTAPVPPSAPPEGPWEERLAAIWSDLLKLPTVGRNENFFELGGHSLLLAKLLRQVETEYGRRITMASFFRGPTVKGMASLLEARESLHSPVVPIQPKGVRPPLLWIDGSAAFWPLAQAMGFDQPFLGIPLDRKHEANTAGQSVEDLAARLVAAILNAQPEGPYYLGGYCDMGILAYEAAIQLTKTGHVVGLLALLDTTSPMAHWRSSRSALFFSRLRYHWQRLRRLRGAERRDYLAKKIHNVKGAVGLRPKETWEELSETSRRYLPSEFPGDLILFQSADRLDIIDNEPAWAQRVRGVMVAKDTPGDHYTMLELPHVKALGCALNDALIRAQNANSDYRERARRLA